MTIKKQINKLAKAYRKKANCEFIDSFTLAKWMFHKAEWADVLKVKGFRYLYDYDDMHLVDFSRYIINDVDMSDVYRETFALSQVEFYRTFNILTKGMIDLKVVQIEITTVYNI